MREDRRRDRQQTDILIAIASHCVSDEQTRCARVHNTKCLGVLRMSTPQPAVVCLCRCHNEVLPVSWLRRTGQPLVHYVITLALRTVGVTVWPECRPADPVNRSQCSFTLY